MQTIPIDLDLPLGTKGRVIGDKERDLLVCGFDSRQLVGPDLLDWLRDMVKIAGGDCFSCLAICPFSANRT